MNASLLTLILMVTPLLAAEPISVSRTSGAYRVTITLTETEPRGITSITVAHGKECFAVPPSQFDDIRAPRLGAGYKPTEFRLGVNRKGATIDIVAGVGQYPEDHTWLLPFPLKDVGRLTRQDNKTGYPETRPSTPLTKLPH